MATKSSGVNPSGFIRLRLVDFQTVFQDERGHWRNWICWCCLTLQPVDRSHIHHWTCKSLHHRRHYNRAVLLKCWSGPNSILMKPLVHPFVTFPLSSWTSWVQRVLKHQAWNNHGCQRAKFGLRYFFGKSVVDIIGFAPLDDFSPTRDHLSYHFLSRVLARENWPIVITHLILPPTL